MRKKGCVIVRNAFTKEQVKSVIEALNSVIDGDNQSFNAAVDKTKQAPFDNR